MDHDPVPWCTTPQGPQQGPKHKVRPPLLGSDVSDVSYPGTISAITSNWRTKVLSATTAGLLQRNGALLHFESNMEMAALATAMS